jgi:uncharacterized OB-fold protein
MEIRQGVYPAPFSDPNPNEMTEYFWTSALEGRLVVSRCVRCGQHLLPPQPRCFVCQNDKFNWVELPGTGSIYSFTVIRHALAPHLAAAVPYVAAVVELDGTGGAGARLVANLVDCDPDAVEIGQRVKVIFDPVSPTLALPRVVLLEQPLRVES